MNIKILVPLFFSIFCFSCIEPEFNLNTAKKIKQIVENRSKNHVPSSIEEASVKCDPKSFLPAHESVLRIIEVKDHSFGKDQVGITFFPRSKEVNGRLDVQIWDSESSCIDGVSKIKFYGSYDSGLLSQIDQSNQILFFARSEDQLLNVGKFDLSTLRTEILSDNNEGNFISFIENNKLSIKIYHNGVLYFEKEVEITEEPKYLPNLLAIGGRQS
jgi:hypothetical protein